MATPADPSIDARAGPRTDGVSDDLEDWLRLTLIGGLGAVGARRLLSVFGEPAAVLRAPRRALAEVIGDRVADLIRRGAEPRSVAAATDWAGRPGHSITTLADPAYPGALLEIPDPPVLIYVRGNTELLARPAIAIVGSRNATAQGLANASAFARSLSEHGLTVVSGLALGIDAAAHRGALGHRGSTVAVLGTGADVVYPRRNRELFETIAADGAIISELPIGTPALAGHFPRRNRLISGLTKGCLVVEAAIHSGSLITARVAAEQGREVFAIPGSIHSPLSKGCHALIRQGAKLVESAADILEELHFAAPREAPPAAAASGAVASAEARLLDAIGFDPVHPDTLCTRLGLTPDVVSAMLLTLEMNGSVAPLPGGRYQRLA